MNVLFVCTGNTCRSPMAEAIFNHYWSDQGNAKSVGLFAANGEQAALYSQQVLQEQGIELHHQSKQMEEKDMEWATVILTMTTAHKQMLEVNYPQFVDKIFTLKEYVLGAGSDLDVVDPYGGSLEVYRQTYEELQRLISQLFSNADK